MKRIMACGLIILLLCSGVFVANTYSKEADVKRLVFESKVLSSDQLADKLVRFHVIANSDEDIDQQVKLKVKDAVLDDMVPKLDVSTSKEETIAIINENKENIQHIAEETLHRYNMDNKVAVELNTSFFPTKYYKDFSLPAGDYLALRVIIGDGQGKNWWCVLFPPLCLVDVKTEEPKPIEENNKPEEDPSDHDNTEELEADESYSSNGHQSENDVKERDSKPKDHEENIGEKSSQSDVQSNGKSYREVGQSMSNEDNGDEVSRERDGEFSGSDEELSEEYNESPKIRWKTLELLGFYR